MNLSRPVQRLTSLASGVCIAVTALCAIPLASAAETTQPQRIVIIKADDVRSKHPKWEAFFHLNRDKGVKVSAGVIGNSMGTGGKAPSAEKKAYFDWMRKLEADGGVEFWHHGWDHKRWKDGETNRSEYGKSGYAHQKKHTVLTQEAAQAALGKPFAALGTPFNAMDADSIRVFNEQPELQMIFCYPNHALLNDLKGKVLLPMTLRGEHDGTGKPNFEKFREAYEARDPSLAFAAIQVHPQSFAEGGLEEYGKIIDFLKAEGWQFMLPREYYAWLESQKKAQP